MHRTTALLQTARTAYIEPNTPSPSLNTRTDPSRGKARQCYTCIKRVSGYYVEADDVMDRSILSRFPNPLAKRNTKNFDFEIQPEELYKIYKPGDRVRGHITLHVFKGFEITHLTISLHGYARVFKHQLGPSEKKDTPDILVNGKGTHGFEYHGNGLASLFQDEQTLCGSGFLKKQDYRFEFELHFPCYSLPSTIKVFMSLLCFRKWS